MVANASSPEFTRSRPAAWLAGLVALTASFLWVVFAAGRVFPSSCPAQMAEVANARPGMVLMAGEVSNPACQGSHKIRSH